MGIFKEGMTYNSERGEFYNSNHLRIAQVINDYDPDLYLVYSKDPTTDKPYAIVHRAEGKEPYVVMWLDHHELNETALAKLWTNDSRKNNPMLYLKKLEDAQEALRLAEELEIREQAKDEAEFMLRSPLHTISLGNGRKVET